MTKRYSKKRPPARTERTKKNTQPLNWLIAGLLIGFLISLVFYLLQSKTKNFALQSSPHQKHSEQTKLAKSTKTVKKHPEKETKASQYDFYTMLSKQEESIGDDNFKDEENRKKPKEYVLQIGSFKSFSEADQLRAELIIQGYKVFISKMTQEDITWHRVNVGPFKTLPTAKEAMHQLQQMHLKVLLLKP